MKKIIAFGASNSSRSINRQFAHWAAKQSGLEFNLLDLNDYEMPIYSIDREEQSGFPDKALDEHNGAYTTAFKNIMDWISRIEKSIWSNNPMLLLSTSPGGRGAKTVLEIAVESFSRRGGQVIASFSLPSFSQNFTPDEGITDSALRTSFDEKLSLFTKVVGG